MRRSSQLPLPNTVAQAQSNQLADKISLTIQANQGWISFAEYMNLVLYTPGLGYYSSSTKKFGPEGDFVTAPEISPLFARALARQIAEILQQTRWNKGSKPGNVLELGAGNGKLAGELMSALLEIGCPPEQYAILEPSADLQHRQQRHLATHPESDRFIWLTSLPDYWTGVIFGNEVLDAVPCELVVRNDSAQWLQRGVRLRTAEEQRSLSAEQQNQGHWAWEDQLLPMGHPLVQAAQLRFPLESGGYCSEINQQAETLIKTLGQCLQQGALLFLDYGFPRSEYYHPQRHQGTLRCHYRHQVHDDPFWLPGLNDLTSHVDFTAIAEAASSVDLEVDGFTNQAQFLLNSGILEDLAKISPDTPIYLPNVAGIQRLLSPAEMGELFKVVLLTRGVFGENTPRPLGFRQGDQRHRL